MVQVSILCACVSLTHFFQTQSAEPTLVDAGLDMFNSYVSRMLGGLPDMSSFDLSMHTAKGKGQ